MSQEHLQEEILKLKKKRDVTILAHYYQPIEIQEIADHLGDSLGLSRLANKVDTKYIIFAGVLFMAETASILNQDKKVLIPHPEAYCPLAAYLDGEKVKTFREKYPRLPVITHVNSTAAVKAESDVCCTSSNAMAITKAMAKEYGTDAVLFGPVSNLGHYVEQKSGIKTIIMPHDGHCIVHSQLSAEDVLTAKKDHPDAEVLVHPECKREVRDLADVVGSTAHMYNHVKNSSNGDRFLIGTEKGLLERMAQDFPENQFFLISEKLICYNMKKNSLELTKHVLEHLEDPDHEVRVPKDIAKRAYAPIEKMLKLS